MRPTRQPATAHALLAESICEQTAQTGFQFAANLPEISGYEFTHSDGHALPPQFETPPNAISKYGQCGGCQAVKENHRPVRDIAERFAGGRHGLPATDRTSRKHASSMTPPT